MDSCLGFRLPQFSEDFAWLPPWLQNLQVDSSVTHAQTKEPQISSQVDSLSKGEGQGRYNSCHLFLSGEDTSHNSIISSPGNVLHRCLRLSSDGESLESHSQYLSASEAIHHGSNKVPTFQQVCLAEVNDDHVVVEASPLTSVPIAVGNVGQQSVTDNEEIGKRCEEKVNCNLGGIMENYDPLAGPSYPTKCRDSEAHEEKFNVREIKDADVSDAVELGIAASEALVIHELMGSGSDMEVLPTGTILEAALQIKKARLKDSEDCIFCSSEKIDDVDFLSDLDDSVMESAFLDVGLSFKYPEVPHACNLDMSQVKDTPSENQHRYSCVQLMAQQDEVYDGLVLGSRPCNLARPADAIQPVLEISPGIEPQIDECSSPADEPKDADRKDTIRSPVVDRYESRWFGGWTMKEADASATSKLKNTKGVPKFFNGETSFLSESINVADENSVAQKHDTGFNVASFSSVPFEGVVDKAEAGVLISQEVRSSSQSLVDPLCSVVPCSISSENPSTHFIENRDGKEADAQSCFHNQSGLGLDSVHRMSSPNMKSRCVGQEVEPTTSGECFEAPVRMQQTSLRAYSTFPLKHDIIFKAQRPFQNQQNVYSLSSSDRRNSKCFLPLMPEIECSDDKENEQNQNSTVIHSPVQGHDEPAKDEAEPQDRTSAKRRSPLILNRRTRCRLQPSEHVKDLPGVEKPEQFVPQGTLSKAFQGKNLETKSNLKNSSNPPNLVRKRVCFSELEVDLHQNKDIQQPETSKRECNLVKGNKRPKHSKLRSKHSKLRSNFRDLDVKNHLADHINEMKGLLFQGLEFILTGFSTRKERDIIRLIHDYGGIVLMDVPSPPISRANRKVKYNNQRVPIVICSKKLQTSKFLYGCAVNAPILNVKWLSDSIAAGSALHPEKYMILPYRAGPRYTRFRKSYNHDNSKCIFDRLGIMLHGKPSFCTKLSIIIKHGGGQVFKTLHRLCQSIDAEKVSMGAIVCEDECRISRHLRHCALEKKIPIMPASWIAKSLHAGKLLPLKEEDASRIKSPEPVTPLDWSQEI